MIKILYVEDELSLGKIVSESLQSRNYEVTWVKEGKKALASFQRGKQDICILDVMLPGKNGFDIGKEIRAYNPHIPIIFLTAKTQTQDVIEGFHSGGNDYIRKPFSLEELLIRIENLLRLSGDQDLRESPTLKGSYTLGKYVYFPQKYELVCEGEKQRLSHREAQLLHLFLLQPNQVIARKQILLEIWGDDSFFNSRNLDVYIKRLRDYFRADSRLQIMTLKGVGYQFFVET
ncbi:MAG: response regulator transcription factor [Bacteroidota bacterium]